MALTNITNQYIDSAINSHPPLESIESLSILDFIKQSNFPIDCFMIDRFWNTLKDDQLIYVDDELITWMGYANLTPQDRKKDFIKLLSCYQSNIDYHHYDRENYIKFLSGVIAPNNIYPPAPTGRNYCTERY